MTPEERERLRQLRAELGGRSSFYDPIAPPTAPQGPAMGKMERIGRNLANVPGYVMNESAKLGDVFLGGFTGETQGEPANMSERFQQSIGFDPTMYIPPPRDAGDVAIDVGGTLAGELPMLLAGSGVAQKGMRLLGAGPKTATVLGDVATGVVSGARESAGESAAQAGEFGAIGLVSALARPLRPLLRAATNATTGAAVMGAGQLARGHDPLSPQGLTSMALGAAFPAVSEAAGAGGRRLFRRTPEALPENTNPRQNVNMDTSPQSQASLVPENWRVLESIDNGDGSFTTKFQTPSGATEIRGEIQYPVTGIVPEPSLRPTKAPETAEAESRILRGIGDETSANPDAPLISPQPQPAIPSVLSSGEPVQTGGMLRPLRSFRTLEAGAASTPAVQSIAAGSLGALGGAALDDENRTRGALLGFAAGAGGAAIGRKLMQSVPKSMEEAARGQLIGDKSLKGWLARTLEKNFKAGRDVKLDTTLEQARGTVEEMTEALSQTIKATAGDIANLDPMKRAHMEAYLRSDRSAGAEAMLDASPLPQNIKDGLKAANGIKTDLQKVIAAGERDPEKIKLINDTLGGWQTNAYRAYVQPDKWRVDRSLLDRVVQERMGGRIMSNADESMVRKDAEDWLKEVANFGGDFARMGNEGKSRISQSLYKERRLLSPTVKKILGEVTDPFEREILSVAKLAKSAVTAKAIGDVMKLPDSKGMRFALTEGEWKKAVDAATAAGDKSKLYELQGFTRAPSGPGMGGLGEVTGLKGGQAMMVQRQVLDALRAGPGHVGVDWEQGLLGAMAKLNRFPKAAATLYNPGTWVKNYAQAALQGISAGMHPGALITNYRKLAKSPTTMQWAKQDGIMDAHMGAGEFRRQVDSFENLLKPWYRRILGNVHDAVKSGYGAPDRVVRGAAYQKFLDEGIARKMPIPEARRYAVEMTNRYTHNYSNVAQAVGVIRNIPLANPFFTYTAEMGRIIKNLAHDVVTNENGRRIPSTIGLLSLFGMGGLIKSAFTEKNLDEDGKKAFAEILELLPPAMRNRINAPVDYDKKSGEMSIRNITPWLPSGDFSAFARSLAEGDLESIAENNPVISGTRSPAITLISELGSGRDAFSGRENTGADRYIKPFTKQFLPSWAPGNYRAQQLQQAFTRNEKGELGITDPQTGRRETPQTALRGLFGDSVSITSKKRLADRKVDEIDREISEAKRILRKVVRTDAEQPVKDRAIAEFEKKSERLLLRRQQAADSAN